MIGQKDSGGSTQNSARKQCEEEELRSLRMTKSIQQDLLRHVRSQSGNSVSSLSQLVETEKHALSNLCYQIGQRVSVYGNSGGGDSAESMFQESLQHNPQNTDSMMGLSKHYRSLCGSVSGGNNSQSLSSTLEHVGLAIQHCNKVVLADDSHEEAGECFVVSCSLLGFA